MTSLHRRTWLLHSLAALGAAGMFLGPDGWLGIDAGAAGSAVLYAALWLFLIHQSKQSDSLIPDFEFRLALLIAKTRMEKV
jgi:hypothetical protein